MRYLPAAWLVLAVAGCAEPDDRPVSFEYITAAILRPACGGGACHSTQAQATKKDPIILDEPDAAYASIVGRLASCRRLDPADHFPENCFKADENGNVEIIYIPSFYQQITDPPAEMTRMPLDGPLPDQDIDLIRRWLIAGAENN